MDKPVRIREFSKLGEDERGSTFELDLQSRRDRFIFITRRQGSISGNTWHQGQFASTSPKLFLLLSGSMRFSWRRIDEDQIVTHQLSAPCIVEVDARVTHQVEALSDISLLECNSLADIQQDRVPEPVFNAGS
ncbi:polysaccharide biosynthesis C-terminal domain-containing protein [Legionella sp. CNM-4043-24]|uniref:polysaccharide biosynthesis C-terminal domain-containing protein n=1 Tax=Legionella sp. CNM-4043-24 TaxID=3421646 RepID=UPI00403A9FF6